VSDQRGKRYLTTEEFARRLQEAGIRCTERTVLNWIKVGKVKAIRPGRRHLYIPIEELERILKSDRLTLRLAPRETTTSRRARTLPGKAPQRHYTACDALA